MLIAVIAIDNNLYQFYYTISCTFVKFILCIMNITLLILCKIDLLMDYSNAIGDLIALMFVVTTILPMFNDCY